MPEISPELSARIEQLRSSHRDNPARFFMPLASAYREAGELGQAEDLLRENLKRHPGYLSAHVLLGRCLADRGALGEARNEFNYVLSIDPQNLIALRTLGEMAAANGNADEARRWYGELLAVDPMSAEARQALDALESAPAPQPARQEEGGWDPFAHGDVAPAESPAPAVEETRGFEAQPFQEEELLDAPSFRPLEPAPELGFGAVDLPPPANDDFANWGDVSLDAPLDPPAAHLPDAPRAADALDFGAVELTDDWSASPEPLAADPAAGWGMFDDAATTDDAVAAEPLPELRSFHDEDAAEDDVEMVTETMAELYYRQGFVDRAADVYRELIARRGNEPALTRRLAELENELRGGGAGAPAAEPEFDAPIFTSEPQKTPAWLEAVDAHMVAGDTQSYPDVPEVLPALDFPADDFAAPAPATQADHSFAAPHDQTSVDSFASGATGDSFADSFASGFDGSAEPHFATPAFDAAPDFGGERDAWTPPTVEPTAPLDLDASAFGVEQGNAFDAQPAAGFGVEQGNGFDMEPAGAFDGERGGNGFDAEPAGSDSFYAEPANASDAEPAAPEPFYAETLGGFNAEQAAPESSYAEPGQSFAPEAPFAEPGHAAPAEVAAAETVRAEHRAGDGTESVATYLWSVLSWRPGQAGAYAEPEQSASDSQPFAMDAEPAVPESLYAEPFIESEPESLASGSTETEVFGFEPLAFDAAEPAPMGFEAGEPHPFAEPAPQADAGAPPPPEAWDDQTLGAPEQQPPLDEPWIADAEPEPASDPWAAAAEPAVGDEPWTAAPEPASDEPWAVAAEPELTPANDDDEPWAIPAAPTEALLPVDDEQGAIDELPWLAAEPATDDGLLSVDDYAPAGTEAASGTAAGDEPMPWEVGLDVGAPDPAPTPAPAQPVGGFSFEDFFSEPAAAPAPPAAEPPQPAPAAPQAEAAAADDDEDLESFQAWLQSLKR
ncbi:MAG TPA: tetratricopeptide repeat protein [Longimicrobium sp.]|jgi:hypothetical protein